MQRLKSIAKSHDAMRMLLLLFPEPLGHFADIAATLLGDAGTMLAHFLDYRINIHSYTSYSFGSSMSSSGEQIIGDARCKRRFRTSI